MKSNTDGNSLSGELVVVLGHQEYEGAEDWNRITPRYSPMQLAALRMKLSQIRLSPSISGQADANWCAL